MKKLRIYIIILGVVLLITSIQVRLLAFERKDHDKYMSEVLFKNFKVVDNDLEVQDEIAALESACYLTIDQFNNNGQKDLDVLIEYGVPNIPKGVNEISFNASGTTHRSYTHRGWDYSYLGDMRELWPKRQAILMNTVDKVFDFDGDIKKQESFVNYYIIYISWETTRTILHGKSRMD